MGILIRELTALYTAYARGDGNPLPALSLQYADYAAWQRRWLSGEVLQEQSDYWQRTLADVPAVLELPMDRPRPARQDYHGAGVGLEFDAELTAGLTALSRRHGSTLFMTVLTAWGALLARLSGQDDVVIGTSAANRTRAEIEELIGFFVNALALRLDFSGNPTVEQMLERVKVQALHAQQHQDLPFEQVVDLVNPPRSLAHSPLFQVLFVWQNNEIGELVLPGLQLAPLGTSYSVANFDLTLTLTELDGRIVGELQYATALFDQQTIERYAGYFRALLAAMVADEQQRVDRIAVLSSAERERMLVEWNATEAPYPAEQCIHELFEAQVRKNPDAIALVHEVAHLTYGQLNAQANRLAHYLRELGVGPDTLVALCFERSLEMVVGVLAVLKAGGAYVPLDPAYPAERLSFMLADSAPVVVLTHGAVQASVRDLLQAPAVPVVDLQANAARWEDTSEENPDRGDLTPAHLAYVIYTSGSTGQPKGVMLEHRNVVASTFARLYTYGSYERFLLLSSIAFDSSVAGVFGTLASAGTLFIARDEQIASPGLLRSALSDWGITSLLSVPSLAHVVFDQPVAALDTSLRQLILAGEALPRSLVLRIFNDEPQGLAVYNEYGPTETTVWATVFACDADTRSLSTPIGRPIANTRIYILDAQLDPVPVGVAGELYIGGVQVARGYLNRPELTAERFIPSPFVAGDRLYKTGDLGRYLSDGTIEFLGRNDFQVKIRGFRIELGEIEARLGQHSGIREAVVLAREDVPGEKRLVAYYTLVDGAEVSVDTLRTHVLEALPEYMVPAAYVRLASLPLTPNGKLDRKALPAPDGEAYASRVYEAPIGAVETALAQIWCELLGLERVGRHDNFFALGGHSLLAVRVIERMRRAELHADVRTLFTAPTLADLANAVGGEHGLIEVPPNVIPFGSDVITSAMLPLVELGDADIARLVDAVPGGARNIQDIYPLAPLQEGILFHHLLGGEADPYLSNVVLGFDTRARVDSFIEALQAVVNRHDILRTAVLWEGLPQPVQVVLRQTSLVVEEVALDAAAGDVAAQLSERFNPRHYRLDVRQAPLLRIALAYDAHNDRWALVLLLHHLVSDHATLELLLEEVCAHMLGQQAQLPPPLPFRNFVAQARLGISQEEHEMFFRQMLGDVDEPTVPFGLSDVHGDGSDVAESHRMLAPEISTGLRARARTLGVSVASLCHVAWARVLAAVSGRDDVVFGTVLFGRMHSGSGADRTLGLFINTLPVRVQVNETGVRSSVRQTHALLAELLRHEHASLALAQRCSGVAAPAPLFSALLNYRHNTPVAAEERRGWEGIQPLGGRDRTNYPLTLSVDDFGDNLSLKAQVQSELDPDRICDLMHTALEQLVEALAQAPETPVCRLPVLSSAERERMLVEWNATEAPYPAEQCIHELFEAQVRKNPDAIALVHEVAHLTYGQLNAQANRLAHYLRELGVGPDTLVALCFERSLEMVVGVLAVLKAGGAYVPLDPAYPAERLSFMLADSAPVVVLTHGVVEDSVQQLLREVAAPVLDLVADSQRWADNETGDLNRAGLSPTHLAYVIYTSGSTGQPKGVMVEHRTVVEGLAAWTYNVHAVDADDIVLQKTACGFDVSVWELICPLFNGAKLVMARTEGHRDPGYLAAVMEQQGITILHFVPSMLQLFLENEDVSGGLHLRIICSGEALHSSLVKLFYERFPQARLYNWYGPTEASISTVWACRGADVFRNPPIGRPIGNSRVYILDAQLGPVPVGVAGELYIGGAGVARGYLNRPELTAERFIPSPFVAGDRLYKTGDLGRYLSDGTIEFLGRNDFQVKIRGFRIELGEIEARLGQHSGIREAVVLSREDVPGEKRLVAYYTLVDGAEVSVDALRTHVLEALPEYMVPAAYVRLASLPLTPNGKLDRKALPAPDGEAYVVREYEAPIGAVETALAQIWCEVLRIERVGRHDNFFALGGHSLLAMRMLSRVRQVLEIEASLSGLFAHPVLREFAREVEVATQVVLPPIEPADRQGPLSLSFAQQRLWFIAQMDEGDAYHIPLGLRLRGVLDRQALRGALDTLIARHEALRTSFVVLDGEPFQQIGPAESGFALLEHDLRGHVEATAEVERLAAHEASAPFDLTTGPLIRGRLITIADDEHVLLITMHHIVSDGWSMGILIRELTALYTAYARGDGNPLPALSLQYADYAAWQRRWLSGEVLQEQSDYWQRTLADVPAVLELPMDRPRPARQDYHGAGVGLEFDAELTAGLTALSRRHGSTLFMTVLTAWGALLARLSGQDDVVIGTPVANRTRAEIEELIGFFVNTLTLRLDFSGNPTVEQMLERVKVQALHAQQHQDLPFEQVVDLVNPPRSLAHSPLFQVLFVWQNNEIGELVLPGLQLAPLGTSYSVANFDLTLTLTELDGRIVGELQYATALFDQQTIERYAGYFRALLAAMVADEQQRVDRIAVLSSAERERMLVEWNATEAPYPAEQCIHELFEVQVHKNPDAIALVHEVAHLTYGQLNAQANRLAHYLRELGVGPDTPVALCFERSLEMVVGVLAVLKAGGAYVPLDPAYPAERLSFMLADSAPVVVLTHGAVQASVRDLLQAPAVPVVDLQANAARWEDASEENPDRGDLTPAHLAYVIYTSGSTGQPKGVMVEHRSLTNYVTWAAGAYMAADGSLVSSSLTFDATITSLFVPMLQGNAVHHVPESRELEKLEAHVRVGRAGLIKITPTHLETLGQRVLTQDASVHVFVIGGEALPAVTVAHWRRLRPNAHLINEYGPTETTVGCIVYEVPHEPFVAQQVPIGRPIANTRIYILDAQLDPVPVGVAGELYIGGAGVARGYLNRPELTAERFIPSPFVAGDRLYKTGDLGRYLSDGTIEFLGRNDFQVKIRGFRIELGEIEARLGQHSGIREAVVLSREDVPGEKRLVAYYTLVDGAEVSVDALRTHVLEALPEYMVPAAYVRLASLPLTPNGKLDRKALPAPDGEAYVVREYEAPIGAVETALAQIWCEVLRIERVGRHDNFFALGGHSLLAMRMLSRVRQVLEIEASLSGLFAHPVLREFAREVEVATQVVLPPIEPADRQGPLSLSFAQQRLWFIAQMDEGDAYHIPLGLRLRGVLDRQALRGALDTLIARHEALRTSFVVLDGEPFQQIGPAESGFALLEHDLRGHVEATAEVERLAAHEASAPFDLTTGPLIRGRLITIADDEHVLLITMHHIVSDGWSMGILIRELTALYTAYARGDGNPLPALSLQYADYAAWQRRWLSGEVLQEQSDYWQRTLADVPAVLELPMDRPRPARQDYHGAGVGLEFDAELTAGLTALSRRHGSTLFMTVLTAWGALLARLSGQDDVVIGTPVANRTRAEIEELIGFFVNTLTLRLDFSGNPTVEQMLERVKVQALHAQQHQDLPFEQVVDLVNPPRSLAHSPLFQVLFVWQNNEIGELVLPGLQLAPLGTSYSVANFDLTLTLTELDGRIVGELQYATALFDQQTIERYAGYFRALLAAMVADEQQRVDRIAVLSSAERERMLVEWNATEAPYPAEQCIHELFEVQVHKNPDAIALVHEVAHLTYGQLNAQANRLAHYLRELGVGPDTPVALCFERSLEMVVGVLAVLKAGGAYVPLDPAYPAERLSFMLADSAPVVVLTHGAVQASVRDLLQAPAVPVVDLQANAARWEDASEENPDRGDLTPAHLAYVIYTSGSTGQPKGVMVEHRGICNLLSWGQCYYQLHPDDVVLQMTPYNFDVSVWEFFWPLLTGAKLVMAQADGHKDPQYLHDVIQEQAVTTLQLVPSLLQLFIGHDETPKCTSLRRVFCGGEALPGWLARRARERLPGAEIHNHYGPTEATVDVTAWAATADVLPGNLPIGRPIANTRIYILDAQLDPVPVGVAGELYIGGAGVARGYLNRPELTAERFIPSPFVAGDRLYKTGDLGRYLPDGTIEFLGRNDFQVKIRGFRIELGEIEARLGQHSGIREAVVLAREDVPGEKRLVAYYTLVDGAEVSVDALRTHVLEALPEYMVPAAYVRLASLPLTPNGKLDRKALPAPDGEAYVVREYEAPIGTVETALAQIWCELLGLERVGRHDNFFALGGHSLLLMRVIERMHRAELHADVRTLFTASTLADAAAQTKEIEVAVL